MQQLDTPAVFPSGEASRALSQVTDSLRPATYGCPNCQTMQMIASPMPPGNCPGCDAPMQIRQG